jgi:3-methyladenine DNA glycosylase AlkD
MSMAEDIRAALQQSASPERARALSRFFKTGPGEYGEGDVFIGVTVPQIRAVVKQFRGCSLGQLQDVLNSPMHEERLCALLLAVHAYDHGTSLQRETIYRWYLRNAKRVNNWDLVDLTAPNIVGTHLLSTRGSGAVLVKLARSRNLWERRIALLATFPFIRAGRHLPTFNIVRMLLKDQHDLIHKAAGWMLREVGKRIDRETEEDFLKRYYHEMPRTMLRYAIERFPTRLKQAYLAGRV